MVSKFIKVESNTLNQLNDLLDLDDKKNIKEKISKEISDGICRLWIKLYKKEIPFIYIDETTFEVSPKIKHKKYLHKLTGKTSPYRVIKTYKSWVGLSGGVYQIENTNKLIPVTWFKIPKKKADKPSSMLIIMLIVLSILQSVSFLLFI